jgi:hypothetical protein
MSLWNVHTIEKSWAGLGTYIDIDPTSKKQVRHLIYKK